MLTVYKASAGSGKTYTLAYEYIKLLLGLKQGGGYVLNHPSRPQGRIPNRHRPILAITFTNAAVAEMKERIIRQLDDLTVLPARDCEDADYAEKLCHEFGCSRTQLQESASLALEELLRDYGKFNVSTIDSFFQSVLRTFAREIDHQGDYQVTMDEKDAVRQALALMLDDLNYGDPARLKRLNGWVSSFMAAKLAAGETFNLFDRSGTLLKGLAKEIEASLSETYYDHAGQIEEYFTDPSRAAAFRKSIDTLFKDLEKRMDADIEATLPVLQSVPEKYFHKGWPPISTIQSLLAGTKPEDIKQTPKIFKKIRNGQEILPGDFLVKDGIKALEKIPDTFRAVMDATERLLEGLVRFNDQLNIYRRVRASVDNLEFVFLADQYLKQYFKDNNLMLIGNSADLLRQIIGKAETPFIYERTGMRLNNLLIDEFQDTSAMQWENLRPLVDHSLSEQHDCLIIGDVKQAIYRFRNSNPDLLDTQVQNADFPQHTRLRGNIPEENTNHRSSGPIVRFNNSLFTAVAATHGLDAYATVTQQPCEAYAHEPAYIRYNTNPWDVVEIYQSIANDIERQHAAGYRWRDIAVMGRKRKDINGFVAYLLRERPEIPILSGEALLLQSSTAVRTVIGMLKLYLQANLDYAISGGGGAREEEGPHYPTKSETLAMINTFAYLSSENIPAEEALEQAIAASSGGMERIIEATDAIRAQKPANLVALIEIIIDKQLSPAQRRDQAAYLYALQDLAAERVEGPDPSVEDFLEYFDQHKSTLAIQAPADTDAVRVMTFHASKGLERPCIHIVDASWEVWSNTRTYLWYEKEDIPGVDPATVPPLMRLKTTAGDALGGRYSPFAAQFERAKRENLIDMVNLAYVAFTRAGRELCIYSAKATKSDNDTEYMDLYLKPSLEKTADESDTSLNLSEYFNDGVFEYGEPSTEPRVKKERKKTPKPSDLTPRRIDLENYSVIYRDDVMRYTTVDDALSPQINTGAEAGREIADRPFRGTPEMQTAARRGLLMHSVLENMTVEADLDRAVDRVAAARSLTAAERDHIRSSLSEAFSRGGGQVRSWFDPACEIFVEHPIYIPGSDTILRPDRCVRFPDGSFAVIDYKFTTRLRREHMEQVGQYATLLAEIENAPVQAFLWFPAKEKDCIIKVPPVPFE